MGRLRRGRATRGGCRGRARPDVNAGQLSSVRSLRVTAAARALLATFLAASLLVGLPEHSVSPAALPVIGAYLVWSLATLAAALNPTLRHLLLRWPASLPAIDLVVFTALLYVTSGADSPFFSPFIFLILAATLQWGSRGAQAMGVLILSVFAPSGLVIWIGGDPDGGAGQIFVVRLGYISVTTVMLVAFASHLERVMAELSRLSDPLLDDEGTGPPIQECLRHALWVFGAAKGVFVWDDPDEPQTTLAILDDGRFESRAIDAPAEGWISENLRDSAFVYHPRSGSILIKRGRQMIAEKPRAPIADALAEVPFERAVVIPARSHGIGGWILVLDHDEPANQDLAVSEMVSAQVSVAVGRWDAERRRRAAVAAEDRIRVARDLHDGVLQFLAGAGLQLDQVRKIASLPPRARDKLSALRKAMGEEQRELRGFISTLRPGRPGRRPAGRKLDPELKELCERLARYWNVGVTASVEPDSLIISERLTYDVTRIVREAVANAVRHGKADCIRIEVHGEERRLAITAEDNGAGFGFSGQVDVADTTADSKAPRSLAERIRALDGDMSIRSGPRGATVLVQLPITE